MGAGGCAKVLHKNSTCVCIRKEFTQPCFVEGKGRHTCSENMSTSHRPALLPQNRRDTFVVAQSQPALALFELLCLFAHFVFFVFFASAAACFCLCFAAASSNSGADVPGGQRIQSFCPFDPTLHHPFLVKPS